jgi:hypothetical protein
MDTQHNAHMHVDIIACIGRDVAEIVHTAGITIPDELNGEFHYNTTNLSRQSLTLITNQTYKSHEPGLQANFISETPRINAEVLGW